MEISTKSCHAFLILEYSDAGLWNFLEYSIGRCKNDEG